MYTMALKTKKDVKPELKPVEVPSNTTIDLTKLNKEL